MHAADTAVVGARIGTTTPFRDEHRDRHRDLHSDIVLRDERRHWQAAGLAADVASRSTRIQQRRIGDLSIEIDDDSYLGWYAPAVTPRDRICRLIDFAVRGGARTIVVDVDLTNPTPPGRYPTLEPCSPGKGRGPAHGTADGILGEYLRSYARTCAGASQCATIVLVRSLRSSYDAEYGDGAPANTVRPSFLDAVVRSGSNVVWSSPNFELDDDFIVPGAGACGSRFATRARFCRRPSSLRRRRLLAPTSGAFGPSSTVCVRCADRAERLRLLRFGPRRDVTVDIGSPAQVGTDAVERQFFRVGWDTARERPTMAFVPASSITDAAGGQAFATALAAGRIVVIGGGSGTIRICTARRLGSCPGHSSLSTRFTRSLEMTTCARRPSSCVSPLRECRFCWSSGVFLYLTPMRAMIVSSLLVLGSAFTIGYAFLNGGYWIDPVLPLIGIQLHEAVALVERRRHREGEHH